jgi:protein phosphatase 1 regulatory subunit 16A
MMMMLSSNNNNSHSNSMEGSSTLQQTANDEHEELLAEMELIERLPTQERLKHAKQRRAWQLKKWAEYEKTFSPPTEPKSTRKKRNVNFNYQKPSRSIKFQDHIVLLDAIIRKDYDETEILLESGVTPNSANEDGLTAIHQVGLKLKY